MSGKQEGNRTEARVTIDKIDYEGILETSKSSFTHDKSLERNLKGVEMKRNERVNK